MVESRSDHLDHVFRALAHPARREILRRIAREEQTVTELAAPFDMSLEAASKHVRVLEGAGLVRRTVQGRAHLCRLDARPLHAGMEWIRHYEQFWNERLDVLESLLKAKPRRKR